VVCHALTGARELARPGEEVLILSDSQIAICTTTGAWASRQNKALVERNRREP
jgi:ribonuclease HI